MTVLRRLDAVLESTKQPVLDMKASLDKGRDHEPGPGASSGRRPGFCNTSKFTLRDLKARASQQQLKADFEAYLDGFSPNVQDRGHCGLYERQGGEVADDTGNGSR